MEYLGPTNLISHKYPDQELGLPRVAFLVDVLSQVEPDEDLLYIASHGRVIEVERHYYYTSVLSGCLTHNNISQSVRGRTALLSALTGS